MPGGFCVAVVLFSVIWIGWDFISQTINVTHSWNPLDIQVQVVSYRTLTSFEVTPSLTKSSSNIKWLYQFPYEFRVNFGGTCYVMSQFYVAWTKTDCKFISKNNTSKSKKSRSLTSPRSPRNKRVRPCLLLSTLTMRKASFDCLTHVPMRHPIFTKSWHVRIPYNIVNSWLADKHLAPHWLIRNSRHYGQLAPRHK